jgi:hypothetical protein
MATDPPRVETLARLASIDATLKAILLVLSEKRNDAPASETVPDRVLDGPHGDPEVRQKDPRDWSGPSMKGKRFSECPADYLDLLAERYDYFAGNEQDEKKAGYNRLDAKRARGWAARLRGGWKPAEPVQHDTGDNFAANAAPRW